ncbi:MAG: RNA methyltransferase [Chloroflexi bacterium]|nr:RNA methyltransferase [Chloroflexota bacterium]
MITSVANSKVHLLRSLATKRGRRESGLFLVEGIRLMLDALQAGAIPDLVLIDATLITSSSALQRVVSECEHRRISIEEATSPVLESISEVQQHQGVVAAFPIHPARHRPRRQHSLLNDSALLLDCVADPGNAGTMLRSAAAAGLEHVYFTAASVDAFQPKVVRAAAGAHFWLDIHLGFQWEEDSSAPLSLLPCYLADAHHGRAPWQLSLKDPFCLIIGSEAHGHSAASKRAAQEFIRIPLPGHAESLNAAVATSIVLFEAVRQRLSEVRSGPS